MGFFQKMKEADLFIILDNVKFRKNYFQNRNRFLNKSGNDEWFTVPVEKTAPSKLIKNVGVSSDIGWRRKIATKLKQNLGVEVAEVYDSESLLEINMRGIGWCKDRLNIHVPLVMASSLNVMGKKSELLANIVREVRGTHYVSGPSGKDYLDMSYFENIEVSFFTPNVKNHYSTLYNISK